jgi:hypothetical protein
VMGRRHRCKAGGKEMRKTAGVTTEGWSAPMRGAVSHLC